MSMGTVCVRHDASSAAVVRSHITDDLRARHIAFDSVADVILVASELVGNAVVHCEQTDDLDVAWDVINDAVLVRVNDSNPEQPRPRDATSDATNGRGLAIVAALATEWGVDRLGTGKQVWARVPVQRCA